MPINYTYCFRCDKITKINKPVWSVTDKKRKLCKGKCSECKGNVALMSGYAYLPDNIYSRSKLTVTGNNTDEDEEE